MWNDVSEKVRIFDKILIFFKKNKFFLKKVLHYVKICGIVNVLNKDIALCNSSNVACF